ncbi:response regulator [Aurantiacibacter gilvus]|uniref:Response regulator n=1 Tax=Aurantiacibacter gilvus TaxID=3139141 RepID=A0ABU9IA86_9SPHN
MKPVSKDQVSDAKPAPRKALGRVLLVEDDPVLAMALEDALVQGGAQEVVICQTMKSTMAELDKGARLSAIVIDVHLADRDDGWALAELVDLLGPKRPRIVFSTGSPGDIPPDIAEMGPVFEKPYDPVQLVEVLASTHKRGLFSRLLR